MLAVQSESFEKPVVYRIPVGDCTMSHTSSRRIPAYRHHRPSGQAVVTLNGHDHYLGPHSSPASRQEYDRLVAEWLAGGRVLQQLAPLTVDDVIVAYMQFVEGYYRKDGEPTDEQYCIRAALRPVHRLYGQVPAAEFGPRALKAIRQTLVDDGRLARTTINSYVGRIRRMFGWAVSEQLIPGDVYQSLLTVRGLARGRCVVREAAPVVPVSEEQLQATLPELPPTVAAMVQLQLLTGCRPGEICIVRPVDIDRSGDVWEYTPRRHKTQHRGHERRVFLGPRAQTVIQPWLQCAPEDYCFDPRRSAGDEAQTAKTHACSAAEFPRPTRRNDHYTVDSYRRAITRACDRAGVTRWSPNQLRHARATEVRALAGLEAAQTILGHTRADVTQVYAERDFQRAMSIMGEIGCLQPVRRVCRAS